MKLLIACLIAVTSMTPRNPLSLVFRSDQYEIETAKAMILPWNVFVPTHDGKLITDVPSEVGDLAANKLAVNGSLPAGQYVILLQNVRLKRLQDETHYLIANILLWDNALTEADVASGTWKLGFPKRTIRRIHVTDRDDHPIIGASMTISDTARPLRSFQTQTDQNGDVFVFGDTEVFALDTLSERDSRVSVRSE
jgi:hypothetical protein